MTSSIFQWVRNELQSFFDKANQFIYIYIILEEFTEQLDIHKSKGMTDEQFTTAKDIRRRGKNKVGVVFFNISAMHFLLLSCRYLVLLIDQHYTLHNIFLFVFICSSFLIYSFCRMLHKTAENEQMTDLQILLKVTTTFIQSNHYIIK